ncbi:helix-turn-helix domain-containing protein [Azospirillum sp. SYSU D00513]|uniref:helix-turn-helix domain-containing protein n=1 Tax=Azospirillum sp. SYSU D00513 TaxID=2812561 RepID=UPI001A95AB0D|nr:helix-turn-helix domain-containing protein [Azospirillum sp. SYSU D00513]
MTPEQCYAARKRLGWSQVQLADRAGLRLTELAAFLAKDASADRSVARRLLRTFLDAGLDVRALPARRPGL